MRPKQASKQTHSSKELTALCFTGTDIWYLSRRIIWDNSEINPTFFPALWRRILDSCGTQLWEWGVLLPKHTRPVPSRVSPSGHSQWKEPLLLMQRPLGQTPGKTSHSFTSVWDTESSVTCWLQGESFSFMENFQWQERNSAINPLLSHFQGRGRSTWKSTS